jgi:hypothetical protein
MEETKIKKATGNLKRLKEEYEILRKKYSLPEFKYMNENFEIENIEVEETELFAKMIRKHVTEKIFFVLRSLEIFINPQNAPLFMFDIIKSFGESDKALVKSLYKKIAKYELEAFSLEAVYNEQKEGEFVKRLTDDWKEISGDLMTIYGSMKSGHEHESKKTHKSYFG